MSTLRAEISAQARLAGPLIITNLGMMMLGAVDTVMAGNLSTTALAAVGLGHAWVFCPISFGMGVVMALDPLVAQARGAGDEPAMARAVQRGLLVAVLLSLPVATVLLLSGQAFDLLARVGLPQPAEVSPLAASYARVSAAGVTAMLLFLALRQTLQVLGHLRVLLVATLLANGLNVLGNGVLMNGWFGFPSLGAVGCAWSTVIVEWALVLLLLGLAWPQLKSLIWPLRPRAFAWIPLWRLVRLGIPIGVAISVEATAFNGVQFLMGRFDDMTVLAGHRAAIVVASTSFMVPLGLSTAAAVRVGLAVGAGDPEAARRAARVALAGGAITMAIFGLSFLLWPRQIAGLFSQDLAVLALTASLLPVAAAFQLFDGLQVVAAGVLRGTADTTWPSVLNFVGYWVLGLPIGAWFAFREDGGPRALWWGLAGSLMVVAVALLLRVAVRLSGTLVRYDAEGSSNRLQ